MTQHALPDEMVRLTSKLDKSAWIDNAVYVDDRIFERELNEMLPKVWHLVLHESELPGPGDYKVVEVARRSVVVCRDQSGELRAFRNICRHRGHPLVVDKAGTLKRFQCVYHLWTYDLGGRLTDTPDSGGELRTVAQAGGYDNTGFDKADYPLVPVDVDTSLGFVFVRLQTSNETLQEFLGGVLDHPQIQELFSQPMEIFHLHRQPMFCNWKLFVDNNREAYHANLHYLVRKTGAQLFQKDSGGLRWQTFENGHALIADPRGEGGPRQMSYQEMDYDSDDDVKVSNPLPGISHGGALILHLFPDVMINVRSSAMRVDRMMPKSPGETVVEWRGVGLKGDPDGVRRARVANHNLIWTPFGRNLPEDVIAVERQWPILESDYESSPWSVIAREWDNSFTDDIEVRVFYDEWQRRMNVGQDSA